MRLAPDFAWPPIFAVSIKTQPHGYFCGKDENSTVWLKLLELALLKQKPSTVLSST